MTMTKIFAHAGAGVELHAWRGGAGGWRLAGALARFIVSRKRRTALSLCFLTQFPRESTVRFSRENRFTLFLELL
jgi:hypothetical protein